MGRIVIKVDLSIGTLPAATHNVIRGLPECVSFGRAVGQWPAWTVWLSVQLSLMLRVPKIVRLRTILEEISGRSPGTVHIYRFRPAIAALRRMTRIKPN